MTEPTVINITELVTEIFKHPFVTPLIIVPSTTYQIVMIPQNDTNNIPFITDIASAIEIIQTANNMFGNLNDLIGIDNEMKNYLKNNKYSTLTDDQQNLINETIYNLILNQLLILILIANKQICDKNANKNPEVVIPEFYDIVLRKLKAMNTLKFKSANEIYNQLQEPERNNTLPNSTQGGGGYTKCLITKALYKTYKHMYLIKKMH